MASHTEATARTGGRRGRDIVAQVSVPRLEADGVAFVLVSLNDAEQPYFPTASQGSALAARYVSSWLDQDGVRVTLWVAAADESPVEEGDLWMPVADLRYRLETHGGTPATVAAAWRLWHLSLGDWIRILRLSVAPPLRAERWLVELGERYGVMLAAFAVVTLVAVVSVLCTAAAMLGLLNLYAS